MEGIDDSAGGLATTAALASLGVPAELVQCVWQVLAAVLREDLEQDLSKQPFQAS